MTASDLEYRIKLNMLRIKYSKNPLEVVALCIDSAMSAVEFAKQQYREKKLSKYPKGGLAIVGDNSRTEVIIRKNQPTK